MLSTNDIQSIVESKYNRNNWIKLLRDIFGQKITIFQHPQKINVERDIAKDVHFLGSISLEDVHQIAIYEVNLSEQVNIERNRAGIRNLLCSQWRGSGFAGAFMLCHRANESVLRFSYVSEAWGFNETGAYKKESTDALRFTYLLGEGHRSRTAIQQFTELRSSNQTLKDLTKAFSVEAVSNRFFNGYKEIYEDIVEYITGKRVKKSGGAWKEVNNYRPCKEILKQFEKFNNAEKAVRDYVKKLMGRLVFIQFLQKKGWMGVPANDETWSKGNRDFVQELFQKTPNKDHFIDNVLEPLFNDLNTKRKDDLVSSNVVGTNIKVPYLNGGLFEKDAQDDTEFPLPAKYMQSLLDFFAQYNFTIDENDPDDAEVGVDPEMLGRIFENLLEDNKDKGAFYTPKEIVQYMCRESLVAYLQNGENESAKDSIRNFVTSHHIHFLENTDSKLTKSIDNKLRDVKICDPAIGSGAFPMGLMRELYFCRSAIEGTNHEKASEIKKHIIQQNIYGVDIEKGAVDIARLRFWLSLIVDEDKPHALPNLDFKIMQGNSLLEQYKGVDLSDIDYKKTKFDQKHGILLSIFDSKADISKKTITDLKDSYFNCEDHEKKKNIRDGLKSAVQELLNAQAYSVNLEDVKDISATEKFFLWHTWFSEVFENGGFDIVIGNPPYGAKLSEEEKKWCKKVYKTTQTLKEKNGNMIQKGSTDTYTLFIEDGYNLLKKHGHLAYIIPISITSSESVSGVHKLLMDNCKNISISSYAVRPKPVFENAMVNTSILQFDKTESPCKSILSTKMHRRGLGFDLQMLVENLQFIDVKNHCLFGRIPKISLPIEQKILDKISKKTKIKKLIKTTGSPIVYRFAGGRYFKVITNYSNGSSAEKTIYFDKNLANSIGCILSSNLSFWFYQIYSDNLNWKSYEIENFTIPDLSPQNIKDLEKIYKEYLADIEINANTRKTSGTSTYTVDTFKEYKIVKSKPIIDKIDDYIGPLYGLTSQEIEFIKNYELEFRMSGDDS